MDSDGIGASYEWQDILDHPCRGTQGKATTAETKCKTPNIIRYRYDISVDLATHRNIRIVHHVVRTKSYGGSARPNSSISLVMYHLFRMQKCHLGANIH